MSSIESTNWENQLKNLKKAVQSDNISPEEADNLIDEIEFHRRCENVLGWGKHYFPDKFDQEFCHELHDYLISIRKNKRTNTLAPRGYAKTTIKCFLIPIYQAYNEPDLFNHYLNIQLTSSKAVAVNLSVRNEIETNELLRKDYGDLVGDEKWTEKQFVLKNGVVFSAIGTGDSVRGINYHNIRPDYIIADDLYDDEDIYSIDRVEKKNNWFWSSIYKALAKKYSACIHIQGTAIHRTDLMHTLPKDHWLSKTFKSVKNFETKEVLWPKVESFKKLMEDKKMMGSVIFAREMQNELRDDESAIIKEKWIHYYTELPKVIRWSWSWDTAIKPGEKNDWSVGLIWAECDNGFYLWDMFRKKVEYPELRNQVRLRYDSRPSSEVLVEDKASGQQIIQDFKRIGNLPVIAMVPGKDMALKKEQRLELVSPLFEAGKVFFPRNKEWMAQVVDELINFPNATWDDIVDAITQYLSKRLQKKKLEYEFI